MTQDGSLVLGSPTTFDKIGYDMAESTGRYIITGAIGKVLERRGSGQKGYLQKNVE